MLNISICLQKVSPGFLISSSWERRSWRGKNITKTRGAEERKKGEKYFYRIALLTPCREENWVFGHLPLLFSSLQLGYVFLHLAPDCVLKVLSKACGSKLHDETKERRQQGHRLRHIFSDFSVIHHRLFSVVLYRGRRKEFVFFSSSSSDIRAKLVSPRSFLHFPLTSIFHELICFVAPPWLLLYWIHLVPIHPLHNLSITRERGKLIIYWWNGASMNF